MKRILVVLPFYGGSLPIGRYCSAALKNLGCLVDIFEAPDFFSAFSAVKDLQVSAEKREFLENSFLQVVNQAILARAEHFEPDLVLAMAQAPLSRQGLIKLRKSGISTAMWFVEDHTLFTYWRAFAPYYDLFAIIQKEPFLSELAACDVSNVLYLPLAAAPEIHRPLEISAIEKKQFGAKLSFMGAGYPNRKRAFSELIGKGLKIWGTEWEDAPELAACLQMEGKRVHTEDTVKIFNAADININLHSSVKSGASVVRGDFVNPRTFEIAASGAFQLVDSRSLMADLFAEDEMATFDSMEDLNKKIAFFSTHPESRKAYADKGRERVLREHTYENRMATLLAFWEERIPRRPHAREQTWPENLPENLRGELRGMLELLQLPSTAGFDDVVMAVRSKKDTLSPLETAVLFLDEWKKIYAR